MAQRIEHLTTDQKVGGSSPSKRTETQEEFTTSWVSLFPRGVDEVSETETTFPPIELPMDDGHRPAVRLGVKLANLREHMCVAFL